MRFLIQRVSHAAVKAEGAVIGEIDRGFLVFIGISREDTKEQADRLIKKLIGLRIFEDEAGKTNLALRDVGGELLLISQFTLYADCRKGNRPSFMQAGDPREARALYDYIVEQCRRELQRVEEGEFGAHMEVSLLNDGPFTVILDSRDLC